MRKDLYSHEVNQIHTSKYQVEYETREFSSYPAALKYIAKLMAGPSIVKFTVNKTCFYSVNSKQLKADNFKGRRRNACFVTVEREVDGKSRCQVCDVELCTSIYCKECAES